MRSSLLCLVGALLAACASAADLANSYLPPQRGGYSEGGLAGRAGGAGARFGGASSGFGGASSGFGGASSGFAGASSGFGGASSGFGGGAALGQQASRGQPIRIISLVNENNGDGTYRYSYETENGIQAQEQGQLQDDGAEGVLRAQGSFSFTAPDDGQRYSLTYTADENGFRPQGDHLPTPPPIPPEIQRAIEQNAADEARGVVDDGQYRAAPQGGAAGARGSFAGGFARNNGGYQY